MLSTLFHLLTPRRSNNHRPKVLHPAGLSVLIAIFLTFNSTVELIKAHPPAGFVLGYASNITSDQVLDLTNRERVKIGLNPLTLNSQLTQAAQAKAADMFAQDYWAHISPNGTTPWNFIKNTGYRYTVAGENLARDFDDTESLVVAWMNSPTHKANIVHTRYTQAGIAVVNGRLDGIETTLVVHMFGSPSLAQAAAAKTTPNTTSPIKSGQTPGAIKTNQAPTLDSPNHAATQAPPQTVLSQSQNLSQDTVFLSPAKLKQSGALAVLILLIIIITLDEIIIRNKKTVRFVGRNLAHLGFLIVILLIVFNITRHGGIL